MATPPVNNLIGNIRASFHHKPSAGSQMGRSFKLLLNDCQKLLSPVVKTFCAASTALINIHDEPEKVEKIKGFFKRNTDFTSLTGVNISQAEIQKLRKELFHLTHTDFLSKAIQDRIGAVVNEVVSVIQKAKKKKEKEETDKSISLYDSQTSEFFASQFQEEQISISIEPAFEPEKCSETFKDKLVSGWEKIQKKFHLSDIENYRDKFEKILEFLFLKVLVNLGTKALEDRNKKAPVKNILHEIVLYLSKLGDKHVKGEKGIIEQIADAENISDVTKREKKLIELFRPLMKDLLKAVFPNGAADLNLNHAGHDPIASLTGTATGVFVWKLLNDPKIVLMAFRHFLEPTVTAAQRKNTFAATMGGKVLLHLSQLTAEQVAILLLDLCYNTSLETGKLVFPPHKGDWNKVDWRQLMFSNILNEISRTKEPDFGGIRSFGEYWIGSVMNQIFMNLTIAENNDHLKDGEDPVPRVVKGLLPLLGGIYQNYGPLLRWHYIRFRNEYKELRIKTIEYAEAMAEKPTEDLFLEGARLDKIKVLRKWHDDWEMNPDRLKLIDDIFTPMMHDLFKTTKVEHRLAILGLKSEILRGIPKGLCFLFELAVNSFPGFIHWLDPESQLKKREKLLKSYANGKSCWGWVEEAETLAKNFLPGILKKKKVRNILAKEMIKAIDKQLPDNLHLPQHLKEYLEDISSQCMLHLAQRNVDDDPVWDYALKQIKNIVAGIFIRRIKRDGEKSNPLSSILIDSIGVTSSFFENHIPEVEEELKKLSKDPTEEELKPVYDIFWEHLVQKIFQAAELDKVFEGDGFLTIFYLNEKCNYQLSKKCFEWYQAFSKFSSFEEVKEEEHEHLCRTMYDESAHLAKIQRNTDLSNVSLQQILKGEASAAGKTAKQRKELWKNSGAEETSQIMERVFDFISSQVLPKALKENAAEISEKIFEIFGLPKNELQLSFLEDAISRLSESKKGSVRKAWSYFKGWLNVVMSQEAANFISTTSIAMSFKEGKHRCTTFMGDILIRITKAIEGCLGSPNPNEQVERSSIAVSKEERALVQKNGASLAKKLLQMFAPDKFAKAGFSPNNIRPFLEGIPLSQKRKDKIWKKLVSVSEDLVNDGIQKLTPDVDKTKTRLREIYGNDNMDAFCIKMADLIGKVTPISMKNEKDKMGFLLFDSIQKLLGKHTGGAERALFEVLEKNRESVEEFFIHNIGQIGNGDAENVAQKTVWPGLQEYMYPLLLSFMLKISEKVHQAENDPKLSLKLFKGFLSLLNKQLKLMNKITNDLGRESPDKVSPMDMALGMGGEYEVSLRAGLGLPPEEAAEAEYYLFFLKESREFFKLIDYSKEDLPVPSYMQEMTYSLMKESIGPFVMQLSFGNLFFGDGQEDTFNKMESIMWNNLQYVLDSIRSHVAPEDSESYDEEEHDVDLETVIECGKLIQELVNLFPVPLLKGVMSNKAVHNLSARQWGSATQRISQEWPLTRMVDNSIVAATQSLGLPEDPKIHAKNAAEREHKVIHQRADVTTDGVMIMIRKFFEMIYSKIESGIIFILSKVLGKNGEQFGKELMKAVKYLARMLAWIFYPFHLLSAAISELVTQQFMVKQAVLFHKIRNHHSVKSLVYRSWKCFRTIIADSVKEAKNGP